MMSPPTSQKSEIRNQRSGVGCQKSELDTHIEKAYLEGLTEHGDLGLSLEDFAAHLNSIVTKELGGTPLQEAAIKLVASLNAEDLYLTAACAHNSDSAWNRFFTLYDDHIRNVAHGICSTNQEARDLASSMLGHLFFRDAKGQSRIASYHGRGSLRTWLGTIIKNQVINQSQFKSAESVSLDSIRHVACPKVTSDLDAALLRSRYAEAIEDSFRAAAESLTEREKLVLVLHIEDELSAAEIARRFGVHRAQMTRTIQRAKNKLEMTVFTRLTAYHHLSPQAREECISEIVRCKEISLAAFLRAALR
jgi:RNA polymerase sigma-70 factor (ECF subfamily)